MSEKKIFFSYSRDDSEFVLNLAKELRNDGANVWLDQLDIKPGTRWDKSIEDALDASQTVLVVLSKTSVASHNVMDEVSYALEEGKTVIPVLLEICDIPFRLRRLQFADFTISHEKGIQKLSKALGLTDKETTKPKQVVSAPKQSITEPQILEEKSTTPRDHKRVPDARSAPSKKSKLPIYIIGGIVMVLAVMYASGVFNGEEPVKKTKDQPNDEVENMEDIYEVSSVETKPDFDELRKEIALVAERIIFQTGKPTLGNSEAAIDRLVQILEKYPKLKISIGCHTDSVGASETNLALSERRAQMVKKVLESKGVAANRITAKGYGETKPIADNKTRDGRAQNRRIEINIVQW